VHTLIAGTNDHPSKSGDTVDVEWRRADGSLVDKTVKIGEVTQRDGTKTPGIGISPSVVVPKLSFGQAVVEAPKQTFDIGWESVKALGSIFSPSGISNYFHILAGDNGKDVNQNNRFLSPVGFGVVAVDAVKAGWVDAFGLLIAINVFVGLFNLLPLLPFDGGHIAVATYEKIASTVRRRRVQVDINKLLPITAVVVAILGFIALSSLWLDATRGVPSPF
jgi:membrane-associated protease RseP (regulator of RpoE activity)